MPPFLAVLLSPRADVPAAAASAGRPSSPPVDTASLEPCLCLPGCPQKADTCPPPHLQRTFLQTIKCFFLPPHCPWLWVLVAAQGWSCELGSPLPLGTALLPGARERAWPWGSRAGGTGWRGPWAHRGPGLLPRHCCSGPRASRRAALPTASPHPDLLWEAWGVGRGLDPQLAQRLGPHAASNPSVSQKFRDEWPAHPETAELTVSGTGDPQGGSTPWVLPLQASLWGDL